MTDIKDSVPTIENTSLSIIQVELPSTLAWTSIPSTMSVSSSTITDKPSGPENN
jgi:hypothetical protein